MNVEVQLNVELSEGNLIWDGNETKMKLLWSIGVDGTSVKV